MSFNIPEFYELIIRFHEKMVTNKDIANSKIDEDKWTLKEMVGHLIDSASNNHHRFVRLQLTSELTFPSYEAEEWRKVSKVGEIDYELIVDFWKQYNMFLLHIIQHIDEKHLENYWDTNNQKQSLDFLVGDYFRHMKWHEELFEERVAEIKEAK
ncbi:MAG: hypothetical protein AB9866_17055 [Syntrophobacteraceae bacterium]